MPSDSSATMRGDARLSSAVAVNLAVTAPEFGGDGWESNPPRTPQQRPADGFEDRGEHQLPYIPEPMLGAVRPRTAPGASSGACTPDTAVPAQREERPPRP